MQNRDFEIVHDEFLNNAFNFFLQQWHEDRWNASGDFSTYER
jgi:hypothetical protein